MIQGGRWVCSVLLVVVLSAVTAGCSRSLQRPQRASIVNVPDTWTGGEGLPADVQGNWWTSFGDGDLDQVVSRVLERNQDLRAAAARIEAAQAQTRIAAASQLPRLDAGFDLGGRKQNFLGLRLPGAEGSVLSRTFSSTGLSLNLAWEADLWGKLKAGKLAAVANAQARQAELAAARLSLSAQAARAWFAAIEAHRQVELARSSVESYRISTGRIRARFEGGVRPALDLRLALAELSIAEASLQSRLELADRSVRQLQILMGDYPDGRRELGKDLPKGPDRVPTGLPSELVHRRADLVAAERDLLAADARIAEAKAQLRPSFSLTSTFGTSSDQLQSLLSAELLVWSLIGNVVQPVFNRGRLKAGVTLNQARAEEAAARYESAVLTAYNDVEAALAAEEVIRRRRQALEEAAEQSLAARDLAEQRYRSGLAGIITLLAAQRTAIDSESQLLTLRRLQLDNRVNLHLALGGSF